jgi:hypothetical protein
MSFASSPAVAAARPKANIAVFAERSFEPGRVFANELD